VKRLSNRLPAIVLVLIVAGGMSIALQGWRAGKPRWDLLQNIWDADALIRHGHIPVQGVISSFYAFVPPGTTWLMAPGLLLSNDPRTFEWVSAGALHFITLWGMFVLTRQPFGRAAAYLVVVLYGFSQVGLFYAGSLWPRGQPCFYVWIVYWLQRWAIDQRPSALAAAAAIWAAGMYVTMEIAPAFLLVPVVWLVYRPQIRVAPLIVAGAAAFLVWLPYLSFQSGRDFEDLRAVLARRPAYATTLPDSYRQALCDPGLQFAQANPAPSGDRATQGPAVVAEPDAPGLLRGIASRSGQASRAMIENAAGNFDRLPAIPGSQFILLSLCGLALLALGMSSTRIRKFLNRRPVLMPRRLTPIRDRLLELGTRVDGESPGAAAFLGAALAVPWLALLLVTEADRAERFWWLWPLQLITIAGPTMWMLRRSKALQLPVALLLLSIMCDTAGIANRVRSWTTEGWGGRNSDEARVVDYIASRLTGRAAASIGYQIYFAPFMPRHHFIERRYRVGAEMDVLFEHRYGLHNADQCGEGFAPDNDYRVVQTDSPQGLFSTRFDVPPDPRFAPIQQLGRFTVFERTPTPVSTP
jgi:hypothetical protein